MEVQQAQLSSSRMRRLRAAASKKRLYDACQTAGEVSLIRSEIASVARSFRGMQEYFVHSKVQSRLAQLECMMSELHWLLIGQWACVCYDMATVPTPDGQASRNMMPASTCNESAAQGDRFDTWRACGAEQQWEVIERKAGSPAPVVCTAQHFADEGIGNTRESSRSREISEPWQNGGLRGSSEYLGAQTPKLSDAGFARLPSVATWLHRYPSCLKRYCVSTDALSDTTLSSKEPAAIDETTDPDSKPTPTPGEILSSRLEYMLHYLGQMEGRIPQEAFEEIVQYMKTTVTWMRQTRSTSELSARVEDLDGFMVRVVNRIRQRE